MKLLLTLLLVFHAAMIAPGQAVVSFRLETRGCLYRNETFLQCWESPGEYNVHIGASGPLDAAFRPHAGDVIRLVTPEGTASTPLRWWRYLPIIR